MGSIVGSTVDGDGLEGTAAGGILGTNPIVGESVECMAGGRLDAGSVVDGGVDGDGLEGTVTGGIVRTGAIVSEGVGDMTGGRLDVDSGISGRVGSNGLEDTVTTSQVCSSDGNTSHHKKTCKEQKESAG